MTAISNVAFKRPIWQTAIILTLGFWLSASLVLDWVIMPSLYLSGMMNQGGFTTAGYAIFWNFNRMELLSAAVVLTGALVLSKTQFQRGISSIVIS
ncbi:membrane protein, partial [Nostoc linckia z7]